MLSCYEICCDENGRAQTAGLPQILFPILEINIVGRSKLNIWNLKFIVQSNSLHARMQNVTLLIIWPTHRHILHYSYFDLYSDCFPCTWCHSIFILAQNNNNIKLNSNIDSWDSFQFIYFPVLRLLDS